MRTVLLILIRAYQLILSPVMVNNCRFHPTCSDYAAAAVREHGALGGLKLTLKRLLRCHPWHPGGLDPVPPHHCSRSPRGS